MEIKGLNNLTYGELFRDIDNGGKFVVYTYTISIIIMTFKRPSDIYYIKSNESPIKYGWKYLLGTMFLGWWGIPFGPIYSIASIITAFTGKDVTTEVMNSILNSKEDTPD